MISNAKDQILTDSPGTLPNVQGAMLDWFQPLTFTRIVKTVVNFQVVETSTQVSTKGVRQPLKPRELALKPEGQRAWQWETIHATPDLVLSPDDVVVFKGEPYRVMGSSNWSEYGYVEYQIVRGYDGDGA